MTFSSATHRCNESREISDYADFKYSKVFTVLNETEIFDLTGCLSKCDKFWYTIHSKGPLDTETCKKYIPNNTLHMTFGFTNGIHEIREQVQMKYSNLHK